jgi:hypothetical protein
LKSTHRQSNRCEASLACCAVSRGCYLSKHKMIFAAHALSFKFWN